MTAVAARPFPEPHNLVVLAVADLRQSAVNPPTTNPELRRVAQLPRPWDPPSCPEALQRHIWSWLVDVAAWINEEHCWRIERLIPACWPAHPHIAHELATVAFLRLEAGQSLSPEALETWHRHTLTQFLDRVAERVGATGCPPGRHTAAPAESRHAAYRDAFAVRPARAGTDGR